ncbi:MAG TPA: GNAT family N-acetyltransferase [Pyrinomonadaceae bacterium]|nr:GNAT family N-acetyltransferase [Pyrinomonadaceae bacterium]
MPHSVRLKNAAAAGSSPAPSAYAPALDVRPLTEAHRQEVLAFISPRSVDTIFMRGLILDNGMESDLNRGTLYGCRDAEGRLEGVALIGHAMVIEAHTEGAYAAFARLAHDTRAHVILGDQEKIENFWKHYERGGQEPRRICRELLMEMRWPLETLTEGAALRPATADDLDALVSVNARMGLEESGINPLDVDPEGFRARLLRRIEMGRVWVWTEGGRLLFKVDVIADVPGCIYLEAVYVHPEERRKGYGRRAMSQLGRILLPRAETLCLLVNEQNKDAQVFFFKAGYKLRACYDTIFLRPKATTIN